MNLVKELLGPVGVMPRDQINAYLSDELTMRIGIPHKGGQLAVHAEKQGYAAMVSASAFFDWKSGAFKVPQVTPLNNIDWALDSAGFVAMNLLRQKGPQRGMAGIFPWTYEQYLNFASEMRPAWHSQPDLCMEPDLCIGAEEADWRLRATATLLFGSLMVLHEWQNQLARETSESVVRDLLRPVVPVAQGWNLSQYLRSIDMMMEVWEYWQPWVAPPSLIGIGSVCRRDLHHPEHGLLAILAGLEGRLPPGCKVHLFGVKGAAIEKIRSMFDFVASFDSMAWDYGARRKARAAGVSNTMLHRSAEMTRWMDKAAQQMAEKAGDQFRFSFHA